MQAGLIGQLQIHNDDAGVLFGQRLQCGLAVNHFIDLDVGIVLKQALNLLPGSVVIVDQQ
jgi:hypothetical protein